MSLFGALGRLIHRKPATRPLGERDRTRLLEAWGLDDTAYEGTTEVHPDTDDLPPTRQPLSAYDRVQWQRKLRSILERLPESEGLWEDLMADVGALGLEPAWVRERLVAEFTLLVRRAVADCIVTPQEHRGLDLARTLIGLEEPEAAAIVQSVVSEAEAFFGAHVEGTGS